jgi:hypothetical protein
MAVTLRSRHSCCAGAQKDTWEACWRMMCRTQHTYCRMQGLGVPSSQCLGLGAVLAAHAASKWHRGSITGCDQFLHTRLRACGHIVLQVQCQAQNLHCDVANSSAVQLPSCYLAHCAVVGPLLFAYTRFHNALGIIKADTATSTSARAARL